MGALLAAPATWLTAAFFFAFLITFDKTFRAMFAPLMLRVGNINFGPSRFVPDFKPLHFLVDWVTTIEEWTKHQMLACERAMAWSIQLMRSSFDLTVQTIGSMAHNYALAFDAVWHGIKHAVPRVVRQTIVRPVQKAASYSDAKLRARVRALEGSIGAIKARINHLTHATAGAIAAPFPRIGKLEREVVNAVKGLGKVKWLWKYGTLAALGAAVLAKLGISYTRCARGKDFGKRLCKTNGSWLDDFFLATTVFLTATSVVEFIKAAQEGEKLALESIQVLVTEFGELNLDRDAVKDLINPLSIVT